MMKLSVDYLCSENSDAAHFHHLAMLVKLSKLSSSALKFEQEVKTSFVKFVLFVL